MNFIIIFYITYFLSYFGFLLGKSTEEEHKEIKKFINYIVDVLLIITYAALIYTFKTNLFIISTIIVLIILKFISKYHKKYFLDLHNVGLLSITLISFYKNLYIDEVYFTILPLLVLIFDNSFHKFNIKIELYKIIFATIFLIVFSI